MGAARRRGTGGARPQGRADGEGIGPPSRCGRRQGQSGTVGRGRAVRGRDRRSGQGRRQSRRAVRRPAFPGEGPRPHHEGPAPGNGLAVDARQSRRGRYVPDRQIPPGRAEPDRTHHDAGIRRMQLGRQSGRLRHAQSLGYRLHHLRLVRGERRDGRGRRGADRTCNRWRRFDPHSRRGQRQYRS
ncbi:hypothetical protein ACVWWP_001845 [Bradyrhizobium sp. LM3.6]